MYRSESCSSTPTRSGRWESGWRLALGGVLVGLPLPMVRFHVLGELPSTLALGAILAAAVFPATAFAILTAVLGTRWAERVALGLAVVAYVGVLLLHVLYFDGRGGLPRLRQAAQIPDLLVILPTLGPLFGFRALFALATPVVGVALLRCGWERVFAPRLRSLPLIVGLGGIWIIVLVNWSGVVERSLLERAGVGRHELKRLEPVEFAAKLGLVSHWRSEIEMAWWRQPRSSRDYPGPLRELLAEPREAQITAGSEAEPFLPLATVGGSERGSASESASATATETAVESIRNLLWIQVESWDPALVEGPESEVTMPFLRSLAARGTYFPNFWAQHSGGGTSDAELASLISLMPLSTHASLQTFDPTNQTTLPERLREVGYTTLAFHGYRPTYYGRSEIYPRIGFDRFHAGEELTGRRPDIAMEERFALEAAAEILSNTPEPFFGLIITVQGHGPLPGVREYRAAMSEVDAAMADFWASLESSGVLKNTAVFIFGDHLAGRLSYRIEGKERVPMIVWTPGQPEFDPLAPASHLDLAPTALELLGVEAPSGWLGGSLVGASLHDAAVAFNDLRVLRTRAPARPVFVRDQRARPALLYSWTMLDP